jgi:hypothetical protein
MKVVKPQPRINAADLQRGSAATEQARAARRQESLELLTMLTQARGRALGRVVGAFAAAKADDDPEAQAAKRALARNDVIGRHAQSALARLQVTPPQPAADSWVVHGFVRTADGTPVQGYRVRLFVGDREVAGVEATPSDATGYYVTTLRREQLVPALAASATLAESGAMSAGLALGLRVATGTGAIAARPADQFIPENGVVDELDVRLPA